MFNVNDTVTITGKTGKGKNRVREHGTERTISEISDRVTFDQRTGPWLRLVALDGYWVWVHHSDDKDFTVTK